MNRRNFLKTVGMASIATLIPFNLNADDKGKESIDVREIDTISLDYLKYSWVNFNAILNVNAFYQNARITSNVEFVGKTTEEKLINYYKKHKEYSLTHEKELYVWFLENKVKSIEELEFPATVKSIQYEYRVFGYYGLSNTIDLQCKMDNKYILRRILFNICGISPGVENIIISDYSSDEKYKIYPMLYNFYSQRIFGLTFNEINKTNIKSIVLPEGMFEDNKKYISIIEKETNIKFSTK